MSAPAEPRAAPALAPFLAVTALLHAAGLVLLAPAIWQPPLAGESAGAAPVRAASAEIAALVELWNTPPKIGPASALDTPAEATSRPDTAAAEAAETGVEAGDASDLGESTGPGTKPERPIFAAKITTNTAPPPELAFTAETEPSPPSLAPPALAAPGGLGGSGLSLGGSDAVAGLSLGGGFGAAPGATAALALPDRPEEESFAPETAPLPRPRPDPATLAAEEAEEAEEEEDTTGPATPSPAAAPALPGASPGPAPLPEPALPLPPE